MSGHDHQDYRTPQQRAREDVNAAIGALDSLVEAWPWLNDLAIPGPTGPVQDFDRDWRHAAAEQDQHLEDATAKHKALKAGRAPTGHSDAARVAPIDTRAAVARSVRDATKLVWAHVTGGDAVSWPIVDPTARVRSLRCYNCHGGGLAEVPVTSALMVTEKCTVCSGSGALPTGSLCSVCHERGPCHCDQADALMAAAGDLLTRSLPQVASPSIAAEARRILERADRYARRTVHATAVIVGLDVRCPACRRRDMVADCTHPDRGRWTIRCRGADCRCVGDKCGCRRANRMEGQEHVWLAADWDGPAGLAARLKIKLPGVGKREQPMIVSLMRYALRLYAPETPDTFEPSEVEPVRVIERDELHPPARLDYHVIGAGALADGDITVRHVSFAHTAPLPDPEPSMWFVVPFPVALWHRDRIDLLYPDSPVRTVAGHVYGYRHLAWPGFRDE